MERASSAGRDSWRFVRHEDLTADGGSGFAPTFRRLFEEGRLIPSAAFPTPYAKAIGRSDFNASATASQSAYAKLTAGRWPQFTERQFATRAHMTKTRPLAPTFDREVLNHIQSGLDLALEAELGYDYAFPALRLP